MSETKHITVVSDNELSREGLKRLIVARGFSVSCLSLHRAEEMEQAHNHAGHIVLVDTDAEAHALPIARSLRSALSEARIVLLCADFSLPFIREGLALGFNGFLTKDVGFSVLMQSLRLIGAGQKLLPTRCIDHLVGSDVPVMSQDWADACDNQRLSGREIGILRCLVDGDANKVISRRLNIAEPTVKVHIKAILRKLKVENRTQAAVWAMSQRAQAAAIDPAVTLQAPVMLQTAA